MENTQGSAFERLSGDPDSAQLHIYGGLVLAKGSQRAMDKNYIVQVGDGTEAAYQNTPIQCVYGHYELYTVVPAAQWIGQSDFDMNAIRGRTDWLYTRVDDTHHTRACDGCLWRPAGPDQVEECYYNHYECILDENGYSTDRHSISCPCGNTTEPTVGDCAFPSAEYTWLDAKYHGLQCEDCLEIGKLEEHTFVGGTCIVCDEDCQHQMDENGKCTICGEEFEAVLLYGEDDKYYLDSFQDALGCDETVKLLKDVTVASQKLEEQTGMILDLNGKTLSAEVYDGILTLPINAVTTDVEGTIGKVNVRVDSGNFDYFPLTVELTAKNKLIPEGEPTFSTKTIDYGQKVGEIKLSCAMKVGETVVPGTFAWTEPDLRPASGPYTAAWTFTPDDGKYATVSGTSEITVSALPATIPVYTVGGTVSEGSLTGGDETPVSGALVTIRKGLEILRAAAKDKTLSFMDLSLLLVQNGSEEELATTTTVLELLFSYDTARKDITVLRMNDGKAEALRRLDKLPAQAEDGTYYVDAQTGAIHIFAASFDTYAIGYTPEPADPGAATGDAGMVLYAVLALGACTGMAGVSSHRKKRG